MGAGGLLYAIGEMSYAHLYGATDPFSLRWIYALYGVAYLFIGFGILLGFASLVPGWPVIGGAVSLLGALLIAFGWFGYLAGFGSVAPTDALWTIQLDAIGFFFLFLGIMFSIGGLASYRTRPPSRLLSWARGR